MTADENSPEVLHRINVLSKRETLYRRLTEDVRAARVEMDATGSDRAAVLVCFALVDRAIFETLTLFLADCDDTEKLLNAENGTLGPFVPRVRLCVSLGLIPKQLADAARELAKIRNQFAHTLDRSFGDKNERALSKAEMLVQQRVAPDLTQTQRYRNICADFALQVAMLWTEDMIAAQRVIPPLGALA